MKVVLGDTHMEQGRGSQLEEWVKEAGEVPETTCPDLNKAIKLIDRAMSNCRTIDKAKCDSCSDYASDAYYDLSGLEDDLEKIRKDNDQLRELGKFWYQKCKKMMEAPLES